MPESLVQGLPYVLRLDDSDHPRTDGSRVYEARVHDGPHTSNWIARLQAALARLKFALVPGWDAGGHEDTLQRFDDPTEWAVREFQMAAKLPNAEHATTGNPVPLAGDARYPDGEPVSGVVNARTLAALLAWAGQDLVCPVRVAVLNALTNQPQPGRDYLWRDVGINANVQVQARDRSGHYATGPAATPRDLGEFQPLAELLRYHGVFGPVTNDEQAWKEAGDFSEVLPARCFDLPAGDTADAQERRARMLSTFRVVRATADAECLGFFEGGNAYDDQVISFGLCHWTVHPRNESELPAFLSYLRHRAPDGFAHGFGKFGLGGETPWRLVAGSADGRELELRDASEAAKLRTYVTAITQQAEDGLGAVAPKGLEARRNLRYWHWYHRFAMAGRTIAAYRRAMWDLARIRLREILAVRWPAFDDPAGPFPYVGANPEDGRPATLGETFRSEQTVAMLLRWHVKRPAHVARMVAVGQDTRLELIETYRHARTRAGNPFDGNHRVTDWTSVHERALAEALLTKFEQYVTDDRTMRTEIVTWEAPKLADDRGYRLRRVMPGLAASFPILDQGDAPRAFQTLVTAPADTQPWQAIPMVTADTPSPLRTAFANAGVTLSARAQFKRMTPLNVVTNAVWHVRDLEEHEARTRLFRLKRAGGVTPGRIDVDEYPVLSQVRSSFSLDSSGLPIRLPVPPSTEPLVTFEGGDATALLAELDAASDDGIAPAVLATLATALRAALPETDIRFADVTVAVLREMRDGAGIRWTIPTIENPSLTFFTVRKVADDRAEVDPPGNTLRYGGNPLRFGADTPQVARLRRDLRELGYHLIPDPTGGDGDNRFDQPLVAAVRAFQAYARRARVARLVPLSNPANPLVKRLEVVNVPEAERYHGPVSGVVDRETAALIEHWLSMPRFWRCPVVIDARSDPAEGAPADAQVETGGDGEYLDNLWGADADTDPGHFFFVTDFSAPGDPRCRQLGRYAGGPKVTNSAGFTPARRELTAEYLTGVSAPTGSTLSTYRVVRAVADGSTCGGFLDAVDAVAPVRGVTLGWFDLRNTVERSKLVGGLGALMSVARHLELRHFHPLVGRDGIREGRPWSDGTKLEALLRGDAHATLASEVARQDGDGRFAVLLDADDIPEWRGWHFVYRLAEAGRSANIARAVWDLARLQLLRFRGMPLRHPFRSTLGALLTSEQAWAVYYFWFTRFPGDVVTRPAANRDAEAADPVEEAVTAAGLTAPPANDAEEGALVDRLVERARALHPQAEDPAFWQTLDDIIGDDTPLSRARNSFQLDLNHRPYIPDAVSNGVLPAVIRVGPTPTPSDGGQSVPMVGIGCEPDPVTGRLRLTHAFLGLPDLGGGAGAVRCVRVPLLAPVADIDLPLEPDDDTTVSVIDGPGGEAEQVAAFRVDPAADPATLQAIEDLDLRFDSAALLGAGGNAGVGRIALAGLEFDGDGELTGGIRAVLAAATPFGTLPVVFAGSGDDGEDHTGTDPGFPDVDFPYLTWDADAGTVSGNTTTLGAKLLALAGWPLALDPATPFGLVAAEGPESFTARLSGALTAVGLDLVPTLVRLELQDVRLLIDSAAGLSLALREGVERARGMIGADMFADATEKVGADVFEKYVNHVYEQLESTTAALGKLFSLAPADAAGVLLGDGAKVLGWDPEGRAELVTEFFRGLSAIEVNTARRLRTFAGEVFGATTPLLLKFLGQRDVNNDPVPARLEAGRDPDTVRVVIPLALKVNDEANHADDRREVFRLLGEFGFQVATTEEGVKFGPGAFAADSEVVVTVEDERFERGRDFAGFLSLHVPKGSTFVFSTDPTRPSIRWDRERTLARTAKKIFVRVPASEWSDPDNPPPGQFDPNRAEAKRFTFELEKLGVGTGGFDLKGAVRVENVSLNDDDENLDQQATTGLKAPLAVQRPEVAAPKETDAAGQAPGQDGADEPVGVIEFANSRLVRGSLRAGFQLRLFDDAKGVISFLVSEDRATKALTVVGTVEINTALEYRLEELLATFHVTALKLRTGFSRGGDGRVRWESEGTISGAAKFLPSSGSRVTGPLAAVADLFSGVTCEFEDLNPVKLGRGTTVTFHFPPKTFTLGNVMEVDLSGITVGDNSQSANRNKFSLLGDVRLRNLPGINGSLTFGGIDLTAEPGKLPVPTFKRIGAALAIPGGGEFEAFFERVENERERGFAGGLALRPKVLPPVTGMISLTEARCIDPATKRLTDDVVPSLALNTTVGIDAPLGYGFYLREFGLGLGVFRSLRNLGGASRELPITRRILRFVEDPNGLPDPSRPDGWEPDPPARPGKTPPNWMAVGKALITFGKLAPDRPHVFAGSLLAAVDHTGKLTLGVNLWLFTSPSETRQAEFLARPVGRGAVQLDPDAGTIFAVFRTLPDPRLGAQAPPLIGQVLSVYQTQLMFLADRNGFLVEVGWPWETRVTLPLPSPLRGALTSGYRYGVYRGVVVTQLNYGIDLQLDAEAGIDFNTPLGTAGARFTVRGSGYFRASVVGALDQEFRPSLLGDVRVAATVQVGVQVHAELSRKITRWCKIRLRIRISASFNLSISAALAAAFEADGLPAYAGDADVAVSVSGYRIAGRVPFQCRADKVQATRTRLQEILPEPISGPSFFGPLSLRQPAEPARVLAADRGWHYRARRVGATNKVVVAILPEPGLEYPPLADDPDGDGFDPAMTRFKLRLTDAGRAAFVGFAGEVDDRPGPRWSMDGNTLTWQEYLEGELLSTADMTEEFERLTDDPDDPEQPAPRPLTVSLFLYGLGQAVEPASGFDGVTREAKDPRTVRPREDDADDHTSRVAPRTDGGNGSSPYFRRDSAFDQAVSQSCDRSGGPPAGEIAPSANPDGDVDGVSTGLIAAEVISLYESDAAAEGGGAPEGLFVANRLRVVLVFETADRAVLEAEDPGPLLLHLDPDDPTWKPLTAGGDDEYTLTHYAAATKDREYDLVPGNWFQSPEQVCLCWDFRFEDHDPERPLEAYGPGFEGFRVTRTNQSRPSTQPKVTFLNAAWLDPSRGRGLALSASDELVRAPFQFVDVLGDPEDKASEVGVGDALLYEVEAVVARTGGRQRRFAFKQAIVRESVKPLGPPVAALALHRPSWGTNGGTFRDAGLIELALMVPAARTDQAALDAVDEDEFRPEEFAVRYRFVPAGAVGQYGLDSTPAVTARPEPSLPAQAVDGLGLPDIRFSSSPQGRPMPWEDIALMPLAVAPGEWGEIRVLPPATDDNPAPSPVLLGYRAVITLQSLRERVGEVPRGKAIEFWVGRDRTPPDSRGRVERSVLVRCRHAVEMPEPPAPAAARAGVVRRDYFTTGSLVPALEPLPETPIAGPDASFFLRPGQIERIVRPGTPVPPGADGRSVVPPNDVAVCLAWRLPADPDDGRGREVPYDPVTGYRVYRADRLNPTVYRLAGAGIVPRLEAECQVVSEAHYRSTPGTVQVRAVSREVAGPPSYTGDWRAVVRQSQVWEYDPPDEVPNGFAFADDPARPGVTLLFADLLRVAGCFVAALKAVGVDATPSWTIAEPFEDRADLRIREHKDPENPARAAERRHSHLEEEFELFRSGHEPKDDPYAWGVAEALGLSAEVTFVDPLRSEPIDLDRLLRRPVELASIPENPTDIEDRFLLALNEAVLASGERTPPVVATLFLAEDGVTVLNALRLTYVGPWPGWGSPRGFDLKVALLLKLLGRDPDPRVRWPQATDYPDNGPLVAQLGGWLGDVRSRLLESFSTLPPGQPPDERETAGRIVRFRRVSVSTPDNQQPARKPPRTLPIERDGVVRLDLLVPDRLAHCYDIAVEPVRRYDLIRLRLFRAWEAENPAAAARANVRFAPATVPFSRLVPVHIERTRPLVPHNLVATPLPGSFQGYVFAHPAEFAGCASAVNAAAAEYSGQTVYLERRVPRETEVADILADRTVFNVSWSDYRRHLSANRYEARTPGPEIDLAPEGPDTPLTFRPVEGTRVGIFAADRYVYPDLPAYYEYRLAVFSTAGRAQSPTAFSPFVAPLHDLVRQRPVTEGLFSARFERPDRLTIHLNLVHPRLHLRPELRGLWVGSDERFTLPEDDGSETVVRLGSLPDLFVDYRIFLNANYRPGDPRAVPVLNPLVELVSPFDPARRRDGAAPKQFLAKSPDERRVRVLPPDLTGSGAAENQVAVEQDAGSGALRLVVPLRFTAEARDFIRPLVEAADQRPEEFDRALYFSVRKGGVNSEIVPRTPTTGSFAAGEEDDDAR
jgi:hypothetical protein